MKKITSIALTAMIGISAMTFTSCKKDHTCECSVNGTVVTTSTINATKKDAKAACSANGTTVGMSYECSLK